MPLQLPEQSNDASGSADLPAAEASVQMLLAEYLLVDNPERIVTIGRNQPDIAWPQASMTGVQKDHIPSLDDYSPVVDKPLAVLALDDEAGAVEQALGMAVRLFPDQLVVFTSNDQLADTDFYAFGFRQLNVHPDSTTDALRWFEYRLRDYKQPPDWLNARFWANPERFELDEESDIYCDDDEE